ncbi:hypothetical protein C7M84_004479 [Penaeus vannamei]|uniref:C-type lectin domain-containing protein n=1 Tax=Penaeus vannamei TaxID=6689 RepID=A0A3R7P6K6_PENVA|nr:hypothetical protein C7M84_004479 [Penaeus vannamei]
MVDFRFYDVTLSLEDMLAFASCQEEALDVEPLYGFEKNMSALEVSGSTELVNATLTQMCIRPTSHLTMFPEKLPFEGAFARCRSFLGYLSVPDNRQENDKVYDDFIRFNDQCTQGWAALFWLGIEGNITAGTWRNLALDVPLGYGRWLDSWEYPTDDYPCATYGGVGIPAMWYNADCGTLTCALCNFTGPPIVRMRGHCKESKFDRTFTVYGYHNGRPAFQGHFFTQIIWDNDTWVLRSRKEAGVEARMVEKRSKGYPLGLSAWDVYNDDCPVQRVRRGPREGAWTEYLVTLCDREAFTCSDGSCVPLARRCDQVANCPDNSDELNCQIIILPKGYSSDLPPSTGENPAVLSPRRHLRQGVRPRGLQDGAGRLAEHHVEGREAHLLQPEGGRLHQSGEAHTTPPTIHTQPPNPPLTHTTHNEPITHPPRHPPRPKLDHTTRTTVHRYSTSSHHSTTHTHNPPPETIITVYPRLCDICLSHHRPRTNPARYCEYSA